MIIKPVNPANPYAVNATNEAHQGAEQKERQAGRRAKGGKKSSPTLTPSATYVCGGEQADALERQMIDTEKVVELLATRNPLPLKNKPPAFWRLVTTRAHTPILPHKKA